MNDLKKSARGIAASALLHMEETEGYSNLVLDAALDRAQLSHRDAALATTLFYGVLERRITLDFILTGYVNRPLEKLSPMVLMLLRVGTYQILFLDKIPAAAAVNEAVQLTRVFKLSSAAGFVNAVLRAVIRGGMKGLPDPTAGDAEYLSVCYSCSPWIVKLWIAAYGRKDTEAMLAAFMEPQRTVIRVNTLRTDPESLQAALLGTGIQAERVEGIPAALAFERAGNIERMESFQEGLFHVQDAASQLCCAALGVQPGDVVADVCAAPGGKSFTLAQEMGDTGRIDAFDLHPHRVELIRKGIERLGIRCMEAAERDATNDTDYGVLYDKILCDVPCSGLGIMGRKPEIRYKTVISLETLPDLQYNILCLAARLLRPGGRLVYSTCTLNVEENNQVVNRFLQEHPEFASAEHGLPARFLRETDVGTSSATLLPHISKTDGFFISCITRRNG